MQGAGLTHLCQRWWGPLSPLAIPGPLGQVTSQPIGCSPGVGDPNLGVSTVGVIVGRALKPLMENGCPLASVGPQNWDAVTSTVGFEDVEPSMPQAGHVVPLSPPTRGSAHRRSHPPLRRSPGTGRATALSLPPRKCHGVPGPVAALELRAVGPLGAAR